MKSLVFVAVLFVVATLVSGGPCAIDEDCVKHALTHCTHHTHGVCHMQQCECTPEHNATLVSGGPCAIDEDCVKHAMTHCTHDTHGVCHMHQCECTPEHNATLVSGDSCTANEDCVKHAITHCTHHTHVVCHLADHDCECTLGHNGQLCITEADCTCSQDSQHAHCIKGDCHCVE